MTIVHQDMFYLTARKTDGSSTEVWPTVSKNGNGWNWKYVVPEGITAVADMSVCPGDTVQGEISISLS